MVANSNSDNLPLSYLDVLDEEDRSLRGEDHSPVEELMAVYRDARRHRDAVFARTTDDVLRRQAEDSVISAERDFRISLFDFLHSRRRAALCLSGGGIRSATFGLGILQGLATCSRKADGGRPGLLGEFDFLSTVSGGGYVGAWFSSWASRLSNRLPKVSNSSARTMYLDGPARVIEALSRLPDTGFEPEPPEVHHFRAFSNYLAPRTGLFSADTWTLAAIVARNMMLNWLVLVPLFAAILLIPVLGWRLLWLRPTIIPSETLWFLVLTPFLLIAMAVAYMGYDLPNAGNAERSAKSFVQMCLLPLAISAAQLNIFWAWLPTGSPHAEWWDLVSLGKLGMRWWHFALFGAVSNGAGMLAGILFTRLKLRKRLGKAAFLEAAAATITGSIGGATAYAIALLVPISAIGHILHPKAYTIFGFPVVMGVFWLGQTLLVGAGSYITDDEDREWWARAGGLIVAVGLGWAVFGLVVLYSVQALDWTDARITAAFSGGTIISGWIAARGGSSPDTASSGNSDAPSKILSSNWFKEHGSRLVLPVFLLLLTMVVGAADLQLVNLTKYAPDLVPSLWPLPLRPLGNVTAHALWVIAGELGFSFVASYFIDINKFSLHGMYRMRLIRAYLGASNANRSPNPFTGFDQTDNILMCDLSAHRPLHVVNIALNLVHGTNLAWQQRKAESFTSTRLHTGSCRLGYRSSATYGGFYTNMGRKRPLSLGTAITISGAAASPNMGYHSSPLLTLVMTLFNARLGCWLGNPKSSSEIWQRPGPRWGIRAFIDEALGLTNDSSDWLYLSDGGHFENLGLYEMVLRRCHLIVVADAGADPQYSYEDLANAIRKIRVDMGISIEFLNPTLPMSPTGEPSEAFAGHHCAIARIRYSVVDKEAEDGILLYIKASLNGNEAPDIKEYAVSNKTFPQQTTTDQFFDEAQFESYRGLGVHLVEEICGKRLSDPAGLTLDGFLDAARAYCSAPVIKGRIAFQESECEENAEVVS
jgi:hypothetical protein